MLFLMGIIGMMIACVNSNGNSQANSGVLPPKTFAQKIESSQPKVLIDVRTPDEYAQGHIKDAINIDWDGDQFNAETDKLDKSTPVYVYCYAGGRSSSAAKALQKKGFKEVYDLKGGMEAWREAGLPEVK
jgi:rhodanese-related sulfurtransferase